MIAISWLLYLIVTAMISLIVVLALDKHPQYISFSVRTSAANVYTEQQIALPLGLVGGAQQNMAIEITSVRWDNDEPTNIAATNTSVEGHVSLQSRTTIGSMNNPEIIDKITILNRNATLVGFDLENLRPVDHDLTTGDGFGPIYAAQQLFVAADTAGEAVVKTVRGRIYYRMRKVNAQELLGLAAQLISSS